MGCDIHLFTEKKIDGRWVNQNNDLDVQRNYQLFAMLADVRNYNEIEPVCLPKGVPLDASFEYLSEELHYTGDGHSHSYLTLLELQGYLKNSPDVTESGMISPKQSELLNIGILPDSWCRATSDESYVFRECSLTNLALEHLVEKLELLHGENNPNDIRIVFFFDN